MKKIILLLLFILGVTDVYANTDITNDIQLKYRWYQDEIIDEVYYPKKDELVGYLEDDTKIKYGEYSDWSTTNCEFDENYYLIERKNIITYEKVNKIRYILIQTASAVCTDPHCINDLIIYYDNEKIDYAKISDDYFGVLVMLPMLCEPEKLLIYVDSDYNYAAFLSVMNIRYKYDLIASSSDKILFFNDNWLVKNENFYVMVETDSGVPEIPLIKNVTQVETCRVREMNTYRYQTIKRYYDDNYYPNVDGYLPDVDDYIVEYTKDFPVATVEIIKEVPVIKTEKEYIYEQSIDEDNIECEAKETIVYQTEYRDNFINKIPIKIYIVIITMGIILIIEMIIIMKKKVD